jgi:hypothetical protein
MIDCRVYSSDITPSYDAATPKLPQIIRQVINTLSPEHVSLHSIFRRLRRLAKSRY